MLNLDDFKLALQSHISRTTNILTVVGRFDGRAESGYAIDARERDSKVIDGGRQLEREFEVSVIIHHSRLENEDGTMKKRLYDSIFPYFKLNDRRFVPQEAKDEKREGAESIAFTVHFCDTLERGSAETELMGNITFNIISGGTNGITTDSHQL